MTIIVYLKIPVGVWNIKSKKYLLAGGWGDTEIRNRRKKRTCGSIRMSSIHLISVQERENEEGKIEEREFPK